MGLPCGQAVSRKCQKSHGKLVAKTWRCPLDPHRGLLKKNYQNVVLTGEGVLGVKDTLPRRCLLQLPVTELRSLPTPSLLCLLLRHLQYQKAWL